MRRMVYSLGLALCVIALSTPWGLASDQGVNVIVPSRAMIWIMTTNITMDIPSIDTWPTGVETITRSSQSFLILTALNTLGNSDMFVTSTVLQSGSNGPTIPLTDLRVNLNTLISGVTTAGSLDRAVVLYNIGAGPRVTRGRYDLTVKSDQQAGVYTGTVTYTLVNR